MYKYIQRTHVTTINVACPCGLWEQALFIYVHWEFQYQRRKKKKGQEKKKGKEEILIINQHIHMLK